MIEMAEKCVLVTINDDRASIRCPTEESRKKIQDEINRRYFKSWHFADYMFGDFYMFNAFRCSQYPSKHVEKHLLDKGLIRGD